MSSIYRESHRQLQDRFTAGCTPPVPDWKRSDLARDVLPVNDPANE